jgi:RNA polymerase sigma factor (sigma-70 family)
MAVLKSPAPEEPIEALLERIQPRLRSTFSRFRIPIEDAEDLLQQSLLTYLHKRDTIHDPERWLLGTLKNRCLMYWRSRRRRLYRTVDTAILESVAEPRRPAQETNDLLHDLESVVGHLPERCQALLRLRYRLGCEPPEAARRMGYRTSSIYKVLERCLAALTRELVASGLLEKPRDA